MTWNGTADEFWDALQAHVEQRETQADAAVIADVLTAARRWAAMEARDEDFADALILLEKWRQRALQAELALVELRGKP